MAVIKKWVLAYIGRPSISPAARSQIIDDLRGLPAEDPGIVPAVRCAVQWLCRAQDSSLTQDGGVAHSFSLVSGWTSSYPETTGYIIPTFLQCWKSDSNEDLRFRTRRMLDWLVSIQLPDGAFQGGRIDQEPVVGVTFNTGQILLGLAAGVREFGAPYRCAMECAAQWLVDTQEADGSWSKHPSPFAAPSIKTYETHVAWGLFEAERVSPRNGFGEAGVRNVLWALTAQNPNGWFKWCCLDDPMAPLTHTIGYVLRGLLEGYRYCEDKQMLEAAERTARALLLVVGSDGFLPGRLRADWSGAVNWSCLTGSVQIAHCWLLLFQYTGDARYRDAAFRTNRYVRRTIVIEGPSDIAGGVRGSFPIDGGYGPFSYLNWACKFFIDSNLLEQAVRSAPKE